MDEQSTVMRPGLCRLGSLHCSECKKPPIGPIKFEKFTKDLPSPAPFFHCTSHGTAQIRGHLQTFIRMDYINVSVSDLEKEAIPRIFVVEWQIVEEGDERSEWGAVRNQVHWLFSLETRKDTTYRVRVTAVSSKYVYYPKLSEPIPVYAPETLAVAGIGAPINLKMELSGIERERGGKSSPSILLRWESGSGKNASCDFDVYHTSGEKGDEKKTDVKTWDVAAEDTYWTSVPHLEYQKYYVVYVTENFGDIVKSPTATINIATPGCLELENDFDVCPPPGPENIRVEQETKTTFRVAWDKPKGLKSKDNILSYEILVQRRFKSTSGDIDFQATRNLLHGVVIGNQTWVTVPKKESKGMVEIFLVAKSKGGNSIQKTTNWILKEDIPWMHGEGKIWLTVFLVVSGLIPVLLFLSTKYDEMMNEGRAVVDFINDPRHRVAVQRYANPFA